MTKAGRRRRQGSWLYFRGASDAQGPRHARSAESHGPLQPRSRLRRPTHRHCLSDRRPRRWPALPVHPERKRRTCQGRSAWRRWPLLKPTSRTRATGPKCRSAKGKQYRVKWIPLRNPESPNDDLRKQGAAKGAALFARGEGIFWGKGELFFACTNGGAAKFGQIFRYVPAVNEGFSGESDAPGMIDLFYGIDQSGILQLRRQHCRDAERPSVGVRGPIYRYRRQSSARCRCRADRPI